MSSNPNSSGDLNNTNNKENKRIRSIRRQLAARVVGRKIGVCFGHDILIFLIIICTWFATAEYTTVGAVNIDGYTRKIVSEEAKADDSEAKGTDEKIYENEPAKNSDKNKDKSSEESKIEKLLSKIDEADARIRYQVVDNKTGEIVLSLVFFRRMTNILFFILCIYILQIALHWLSYPAEKAYVKKVLKPLDEIAQKADELAKLEFSEDKYQIIEERLTSIEPDEEKKISFGDEDLMGIENAMNSLIQRIHASNQQQARFVNDASHELRTPIAVIQGYANMLARWGREDEKVLDESITAIQNEADNMKHLVEQLLFLARGDAGRTVINREKISLNRIMQEVYEESLMIDEQHIYKLSSPAEDVYVLADEGLIKQAVRILVDNAAKYTQEKEEILLCVGVGDENTAYLRVQDTGIGMKEADVEHMFERFYRADEARTYNGTGLGLSIAKWIVDKHEGHFDIISREDIGTRIDIVLPKFKEEISV